MSRIPTLWRGRNIRNSRLVSQLHIKFSGHTELYMTLLTEPGVFSLHQVRIIKVFLRDTQMGIQVAALLHHHKNPRALLMSGSCNVTPSVIYRPAVIKAQ